MEGVECPVMETLKKQKEPEDCCHSKGGSEEPTGLTQWVHQEYRNEYGNRTRESNSIVRTNAYKTGNLKLAKHESD
jgi:hypothetical protein